MATGGPFEQYLGPNAGYVAELFERFQQDPSSVDPETRAAFAAWTDGATQPSSTAAVAEPPIRALEVSAAAEVAALAQAIRLFGHLAARLDPLGITPPPGDPQLEPSTHGVTEEELSRLPASVVGGTLGTRAGTLPNAAAAIERLRRLYCGTTGYEFGHIADAGERAWLFDAVESERFHAPMSPDEERTLLDRLTEISAFERFLHRAYPGQTRFSIEGLGMLIPMLDELIDAAAESGTRNIVLGMAHRGRLNVLAHVLGKPYDRILAEFEGHLSTPRSSASESTDEGWAGDVKYHAGGRRAYRPEGDGQVPDTVNVLMVPNPSHLEFVDPVVQGVARAAGDTGGAGAGSLAVLIHGDASFPGQGVVAETLNLSRLNGYRVGGTFHFIANNQLGFTTDPGEDRSTLYASDLAKGFEVPVIHVNADDPAACLAAVRLASAYRTRFQKDVLIDLVGYRRWGHNEGDEPSFTQPGLYAAVAEHPTVRQLYASDLVRRGIVAPDEADRLLKAGLDEFQRIRELVLSRKGTAGESSVETTTAPASPGATQERGSEAVPLRRLRDLNRALTTFPEDFTLNKKLERPMERRRQAFESAEAPIDWGHAETLAFATILQDGTPVRITGQDAIRGTFSQRHAGFFDSRSTGARFVPLASLPGVGADFQVFNSPLSENACLGFEYGYSIQAPRTLVLWEAQYGDFINGAQVIVDEFVVSGEAKWGLRSGLVLLLPHAWEGQGPDHSSGRLERFLELAAEDNIRIANCTTAAQYFFLLRRQAASLAAGTPKPLVVMTPKSLLRHPLSASRAADLTSGGFQSVLDDARTAEHPERVQRILLCSGKVWVDLESHPLRAEAGESVAVVRVEELYPFPGDALGPLIKERYRNAEELVWVQEEPRNMGAWDYMRPRLRGLLNNRHIDYVGRPEAASPAEGWSDVHAVTQRRIVEQALTLTVPLSEDGRHRALVAPNSRVQTTPAPTEAASAPGRNETPKKPTTTASKKKTPTREVSRARR